jgi:hypothetical protein
MKRTIVTIIGLDAVQRPLANWPDLEQGRAAQAKQEKP